MKTWARIAAAVGALLGGLFYFESSIPASTELIALNVPGLLVLAPILLTADSYSISEKYSLLLLPLTNALGYWLLVVNGHRLFTRWGRGVIAVLVCLALLGAGVFGLYQYRQHLDDSIEAFWNPESRVFDWGRGSVAIPLGFVYERESGHDSLVGKFVSADSKFTIEFDIGEFAAEHGGGRGPLERLKDGSRVYSGRLRDKDGVFAKVTFRDSGCANFFAFTAEESRLEALDSMARSFQPNNRTPVWIMPWLPDVIRSECRTRSWF